MADGYRFWNRIMQNCLTGQVSLKTPMTTGDANDRAIDSTSSVRSFSINELRGYVDTSQVDDNRYTMYEVNSAEKDADEDIVR